MMLVVAPALALTLDEAVQRAAEVDPGAVVATLSWKQAQLDAAERWSGVLATAQLGWQSTSLGGVTTDTSNFTLSSGALDPQAYFDAAEQSAQARSARHSAEATTLDAQYAAAVLYHSVLSAEAALLAAQQGEEVAQATLAAVKARVAAGLDSELVGRSAEAAALLARADRASADSLVRVSRLQLARALSMPASDLGALAEPADALLPGDSLASPYLDAARESLAAARWEHGQDIAGLLPSGSLATSTALDPVDWRVTIGATWTFDGLAGPFLRERNSALAVKIAETELDAARRDLDLAIDSARAQSRAAHDVAEAARAREALAAESLKVGQLRLQAGLASTLEVLLLQETLADARADRVASELAEQVAILEARRAAGERW
ncbi:MAG: TolC family protein [Deltaproteobacteria bacterium]|nr:TolC family protein [Deltaproteobacteria bacterium]